MASTVGRLPRDYRDDQAVRVSHEVICQWVYAQPVSTLARELIRQWRLPRSTTNPVRSIVGMPSEVFAELVEADASTV